MVQFMWNVNRSVQNVGISFPRKGRRFDLLFGIEISIVGNRQVRDGEPRRNRTFNPQIKSLLLCQLS